jgi:hypothetical protein
MTAASTSTNRQPANDSANRTRAVRRGVRLFVATAAAGVVLAIGTAVAATPSHAVELPGRCITKAGVYTCLP